MSEQQSIEVGDRLERLRAGWEMYPVGSVATVSAVRGSAVTIATGVVVNAVDIADGYWRRLPREASKLVVPEMGRRIRASLPGASAAVIGVVVAPRVGGLFAVAQDAYSGELSDDFHAGELAPFGRWTWKYLDAPAAPGCQHKPQEAPGGSVARYFCARPGCFMLSNDRVTWVAPAKPIEAKPAEAAKLAAHDFSDPYLHIQMRKRPGEAVGHIRRCKLCGCNEAMGRPCTPDPTWRTRDRSDETTAELQAKDVEAAPDRSHIPILRPMAMLSERVGGWDRRVPGERRKR